MEKALTAFTVIGFLAITALAQEGEAPVALPHRSGLGPASTESSMHSDRVTVPAETQVSIQMLSGIHTRINHPNDLVTARLLQPVLVGGARRAAFRQHSRWPHHHDPQFRPRSPSRGAWTPF